MALIVLTQLSYDEFTAGLLSGRVSLIVLTRFCYDESTAGLFSGKV